jgi:CheY-like chemotaxis protein
MSTEAGIATPLRDKAVMVVEDEPSIAMALADYLRDLGADVIGPVANAMDALDLIQRVIRLDGVLLDVRLNEQLSYQVADSLTSRGVPFVFITGYRAEDIPERYRNVMLFEKPFAAADVIRALF